MPSETLVLGSRSRKWYWVLLGCLVFVAAGIAMIATGDDAAFGWLSVVFFGAGIVVSCLNLFTKVSSLRVAADGLTVRSLGRSQRFGWGDVGEFHVAKVGHIEHPAGALLDVAGVAISGLGNPPGITGVAFDFEEGYTRTPGMRRVLKKASGFEGALPDTYGMSAEALAQLLNEWRARYGAA